MNSWDIYSLEAEASGQLVGSFFEDKLNGQIKRVRDAYRGKENKRVLRKILSQKIKSKKKVLALCGTGSLHHYTYGLCMLANSRSRSYGYIHIDHHNDYSSGIYENNTLSCGSFVKQVLEETNVSDARFIGPIGDIRLINYPQIRKPEQIKPKNLEELLRRLPREVYLTIDLDVMDNEEISTDWDQGFLKRDELFGIVSMIRAKKEVIGADVHGLSTVIASQYRINSNDKYVKEAVGKGLSLYEGIASILAAGNL